MRRSQKIDKENLEECFDSGERVLDYFDTKSVTVRVSVNFPAWMLKVLDKESAKRGIGRQALVKTWIEDRIDSLKTRRTAKKQ